MLGAVCHQHFGCSFGSSDYRCGGWSVNRLSACCPLIPGIQTGGSPRSYRECLAKRYGYRVWREVTYAIACQTPGRDGGHGVMPGRKV